MLDVLKKLTSSFQSFIFNNFLCSLILSLIIFLSLSGNLSNLEQIEEVSNLIFANYIFYYTFNNYLDK